jgi:hypothetical protein
MNATELKSDDPGSVGRYLLLQLCENGFDGNAQETALALGRTTEEMDDIIAGNEEPDEDLVMKIRALAREREIAIDVGSIAG